MSLDRADIDTIAEVIDTAIRTRMEQVYGELEAMKQQVRDAVEQVRATAEVLHDNDLALMQRFTADDEVGEFMGEANASWVRFLKGEAERLGWKVQVPK